MRIEAPALIPDFSREVHCLLGLPIDAVNLATAEQRIRAAVAGHAPCFLSTANVNFLIGCQSDDAFRNSVINSDLSVADGMPLIWLARLMGIPLCERVAGSTLFDTLRYGPGERLSVYFFGGPDGVAEAAWRQLSFESKGLTCVGYESPGFGSIDEMSTEGIIQRINTSKADVLVVSLGARKGQAWIERNRRRLDVPVISHLGAVLHFVAGTVKRAPAWVQNLGLEWLWRIKEQPKLWLRYLQDGLALLNLLVTRALPYAWYLRHHKASADQLAAARVEAKDEGQHYVVRLRGAWTHANIARLRRCFYRAARVGKDVSLEMSGVTYVDSAFVGLVMLLQGHQRQNGKQLLILSLPETVRRVITYCCAEFLCSSSAQALEPLVDIEDVALSDHIRP
jgi:N-acetylglucosaminyldiphosphoundecaprenol N-acetyl-beta-D-mannosaminyltransferase